MAASYICDGCGNAVAEPKRVGHVLRRDYCDACEPIAQAFVDHEEELRASLYEKFDDARQTLIKATLDHLKKLPDVPDAG